MVAVQTVAGRASPAADRDMKPNKVSQRHITSVETSQIGPPIAMPSHSSRAQPVADRKPAAICSRWQAAGALAEVRKRDRSGCYREGYKTIRHPARECPPSVKSGLVARSRRDRHDRGFSDSGRERQQCAERKYHPGARVAGHGLTGCATEQHQESGARHQEERDRCSPMDNRPAAMAFSDVMQLDCQVGVRRSVKDQRPGEQRGADAQLEPGGLDCVLHFESPKISFHEGIIAWRAWPPLRQYYALRKFSRPG